MKHTCRNPSPKLLQLLAVFPLSIFCGKYDGVHYHSLQRFQDLCDVETSIRIGDQRRGTKELLPLLYSASFVNAVFDFLVQRWIRIRLDCRRKLVQSVLESQITINGYSTEALVHTSQQFQKGHRCIAMCGAVETKTLEDGVRGRHVCQGDSHNDQPYSLHLAHGSSLQKIMYINTSRNSKTY